MRAALASILAGLSLLATGCGSAPIQISGRVMDVQGTAIERAEVSTVPETDNVVTTTKGYFAIRQRLNEMGETAPIAPGVYRIKVTKFGFDDVIVEVSAEKGPIRIEDVLMKPRTPDIGEARPEELQEVEKEPDAASVPTAGQ